MTDTDTEQKARQNWLGRLTVAALTLEERGKEIEVLRVLYPENPAVVVKVSGSIRSFDNVRQAALHLEEGVRWS